MGYLIINRKKIEVPGVDIVQIGDVQKWGYARKSRRVDKIVLHNIWGYLSHLAKAGLPQTKIVEESINAKIEFIISRVWKEQGRIGTHLIIDGDGSVGQLGDLVTRVGVHAHDSSTNWHSWAVELYRRKRDGAIPRITLETLVKVLDPVHTSLGIQKQCSEWEGDWQGRLADDSPHWNGLLRHCDVTPKRTVHDPSEVVMEFLRQCGYMFFDTRRREDVEFWKVIQKAHGLNPDGWPGWDTCLALKADGVRGGIYANGKGVQVADQFDLVDLLASLFGNCSCCDGSCRN